MPNLNQKPLISTSKPPNIAKALIAPKSLSEAYAQQFQIKLNKYKPSDKAFILANLTTEPTHELVNSFIKSVAEAAEEQFDKLVIPAANKIQ